MEAEGGLCMLIWKNEENWVVAEAGVAAICSPPLTVRVGRWTIQG